MGSNVTRGAMKNLVTDTPAPITVALWRFWKKFGIIDSGFLNVWHLINVYN
jgi:hypothetical protein